MFSQVLILIAHSILILVIEISFGQVDIGHWVVKVIDF